MAIPGPLPEPLVELVAERFRVLGEPARIKLLDALRVGPTTVGELAQRVGLSQQNASKHLAVLHTAGLIARRRSGTSITYEIIDPTVFTLCELVCDSLRDRLTTLHALLPPLPPNQPRTAPTHGR